MGFVDPRPPRRLDSVLLRGLSEDCVVHAGCAARKIAGPTTVGALSRVERSRVWALANQAEEAWKKMGL